MYAWLLQNVALPAVAGITRSRFWPAYREMIRLEDSDGRSLRVLQWARFEKLLAHAFEKVPLYRQRMEAVGVGPHDIRSPEDLHRLPPTTKEEIQRGFPDQVCAQGVDRSDWQYVSTSGTSNRLMVVQDFSKRDMVRASTTRSLHLSGDYRVGHRMVEIPPDICNIVCGAEGESLDGVLTHLWGMLRHGLWNDHRSVSSLRGRIERNWVFRKRTYQPFGPQGTNLTVEHMQDYVDAIRRDRPYVLKALPTYLHQIARYVLDQGLEPLDVSIVKPMGSSVSPRMRDSIERAFRGNYREEYGSAEFGDMACDCRLRDGLHVFMDLFLIEVVRGGRAAADGELGRVLITDLSNFAMPLIRYDIGDVGRLVQEDHGCGRHSPRLYLEGRVEDAVVCADERLLSSDQIMDFFYARGDVDQFQLIEKSPGRFELLLVPAGDDDPAQNGLAEDLQGLLGEQAQFTMYTVKTIKPEASGKFRFVQSRSHQRMG